MLARENPFQVQRVLSIRYRFLAGTWDDLLQRLQALRYRGAIVGPEGSGKTTLLEDLERHLARAGWRVRSLRLNRERRRFEAGFWREFPPTLTAHDLVCLDGAEQLGRWGWSQFQRRTRAAGGLIITAHRSGLLPDAIVCRTTPRLLGEIVADLLETGQLGDAAIQALYERHAGNLRDALRDLYDQFARDEIPAAMGAAGQAPDP